MTARYPLVLNGSQIQELQSGDTLSGYALSGTNSDITSLTGLTTALSIAQGGTGNTTFTTTSGGTAGLVFYNGTQLANDPIVTHVGYNDATSTFYANNVSFSGTVAANNFSLSTVDGTNGIGYINVPQNIQSANYTLVAADTGKHIYHPSTDSNNRIFTIPANSSVPYSIGTAISFVNMSANSVTISITTDTMYLGGTGSTGNRTLAQYGSATALKLTSNTWIISGSGLT